MELHYGRKWLKTALGMKVSALSHGSFSFFFQSFTHFYLYYHLSQVLQLPSLSVQILSSLSSIYTILVYIITPLLLPPPPTLIYADFYQAEVGVVAYGLYRFSHL